MPLLGAQVRSETATSWGLGQRIGECLVSDCQVFRGLLLTGSPVSGQPVSVRVTEQIFGKPLTSEVVDLPHADHTDIRAMSISPNRAWRGGVNFVQNAPVTVLLALKQVVDVMPGHPVLVTSDDRRSEVIQSLVAAAKRLDEVPGEISDMVQSLSRDPNPALAGFLFSHLTMREAANRPELESILLAQMVGSPSVPPELWNRATQIAGMDYYRLATKDRSRLLQEFTRLSQSGDARFTVPVFQELERTAVSDSSAWSLIPPASREKLKAAYRTSLAKGTLARSRVIEAGLDIPHK